MEAKSKFYYIFKVLNFRIWIYTCAKIHKIISKEKVLLYINFKSKIWNKYLKRMKYWRSINFKKWNNESKVTYLCYLLLQKLPHSISLIFTSISSGRGTPSFKSFLSCFHWGQAHIKQSLKKQRSWKNLRKCTWTTVSIKCVYLNNLVFNFILTF